MRTVVRALALALVLCSSAAVAAQPQAYPVKPVRMVVPFPPGGAADIIGRVLAQHLAEELGQPWIVENRAGASGNIGAEAVAKSPGDGYTVLMAALTSHAINHTLERKILRYDLERDFTPVAIVATVPYVLVVHPSVPARSLQELIGQARAHPGQITFGSSGAGAPQRLAGEMLKRRAAIDLMHVPYKGSSEVVASIVAGHVLVAFESVPAALPHIQSGRLRPLAVTTAQRVRLLPDVPTMDELALRGFDVTSTFGILVPAGTPRPIVERLNAAIAKVLQLTDVKDRLLQQGAFTASTTPDEAAQRVRSEIAQWGRVIVEVDLKVD